jgi:hypothetical protein
MTEKIQELSEHIEALRRELTFPASSQPQLGERIISHKSRTEREAELMDIIDQYEQLKTKIERERLALMHQTEALGDDYAAHYLRLKFINGKHPNDIGYKHGHSTRQVYRLVSKGVNRYARIYKDELIKMSEKDKIVN